MADATSSSKWIRGCAIAAGIIAILGCCGFGVAGVACGGVMNVGQAAQLETISTSLHAAAIGSPRVVEYDAELTRFDAMRPSVGFLTFGVLTNRFNDANADQHITPEELDHIMLLIVDIDNHGGNVDLAQYPGGR